MGFQVFDTLVLGEIGKELLGGVTGGGVDVGVVDDLAQAVDENTPLLFGNGVLY